MSRTDDRQQFDTFGFVVKRQLFPAPEIDAISRELSIEARLRLKAALVGRAREVAEAAGGVMGFGSVSREEERVLEEMGDAFGA